MLAKAVNAAKMRAENQDLKKTIQLREKMVFKEPFYYQEADQTPFCPACWEVKNAAIHVTFVFDNTENTRWDCPACKSMYLVNKSRSGSRSGRPHVRGDGSPWG
jgi:hypothetical protein